MGDIRPESLAGIGSQPEKVEPLGKGYISSVHPEWRPATDKRPMKRQKKIEGFNLNEFPDEILVEILSKMDVKKAAKTSVVSRRWRNLWTFSTNLDFGAKSASFRHSNQWSDKIAELINDGVKYRDCVNHVLTLDHIHQRSTLDSFTLALDLEAKNPDSNATLNKWIEFAFSKQVRVLGLDLYHSVFRSSTPFAPVLDTCGRLRNERLTGLYLKSVSVSTSEFEHLLASCPNLETLSLENSPGLVRARVLGNDALRLNELEIRYCENLREIEIVSAPNLVSLKFAREGTVSMKWYFEKTRKLCRVSLEGSFCGSTMSEIQRCVPRVEELELNMNLIRDMNLTRDVHIPEFSNVKQLKLIFDFYGGDSLMDLVLLMMACPCLEKLTLMYGPRAGYLHPPLPRGLKPRSYSHFNESTMKSYNHQCLKVVEFLGWCGHTNEVLFVDFVIKTASHLEDLVFYPYDPERLDRSGARTFYQFDPAKGAIKCARRLIENFKVIKSVRG